MWRRHPANAGTFQSAATTLEDVIARNPGTPCIFNKGTNADGSSLDSNEWWGNSTVSLGLAGATQTLPAGTGNYYSTTGNLRVGFPRPATASRTTTACTDC